MSVWGTVIRSPCVGYMYIYIYTYITYIYIYTLLYIYVCVYILKICRDMYANAREPPRHSTPLQPFTPELRHHSAMPQEAKAKPSHACWAVGGANVCDAHLPEPLLKCQGFSDVPRLGGSPTTLLYYPPLGSHVISLHRH